MANNRMDVFIPKGTSLPARKRVVHRSALMLRKGQAGDRILIPVVEGENVQRADRNRLIGSLEISGEKIQRDVLVGSEIEITIEIDQANEGLHSATGPGIRGCPGSTRASWT